MLVIDHDVNMLHHLGKTATEWRKIFVLSKAKVHPNLLSHLREVVDIEFR